MSFGSTGVHCSVNISVVKMSALSWEDNDFTWSEMWHDISMF